MPGIEQLALDVLAGLRVELALETVLDELLEVREILELAA